MTESTKFKRPALLTGNRAGKMPRKLGPWFWPASAAALAVGTVWGVRHIEAHLETAAPQIIESAGIDASGLKFDAYYRDIDVTGTLPANTSAGHVEVVLAKYRGSDGESIRKANVHATGPAIVPTTIQQPVAESETAIEREDVIVSAIVDGENLTLTGMVPTRNDVVLLQDAALQSFAAENIINSLGVTEQAPTVENSEQYINEFASVLSNLNDGVLDAQIDLDNDMLTGNITTANPAMQTKVKALVPSSLINVTTEPAVMPVPVMPELMVDEPIMIEPPVAIEPSTDQVSQLQGEISVLSDEIRNFVVFAPASAVLQSSAMETLDKIVAALYTYPETSIEIGGHTDSHSSATYNKELSQKRAQSVADYITASGIDSLRLRPIGYGEAQPIASNESSAGRAQNRRVEFWVY